MLSYKHGFHAGNHADVLKHSILTLVLQYIKQKDKPFIYIDTHSGSGLYNLNSKEALKNAEHDTGIKKLWDKFIKFGIDSNFTENNLNINKLSKEKIDELQGEINNKNIEQFPAELEEYLNLIFEYNLSGALEIYPGSPSIALKLLRSKDRAALFELHNNEFSKLNSLYSDYKRVKIEKTNGLKGLLALLPPIERRAVILIDPSYEVKSEYEQLIETLNKAYKRFSTGVYMIWYPINSDNYDQKLRYDLLETGFDNILLAELLISPSTSFGLKGSGMIIINPPYLLESQLKIILPYINKILAPISVGYNLKFIK